ncbi:UNVERIFIED_CONTAM: hypothetical protein Scaly_0082300 [Sesamum calycinum]|uniref:MULE transposase domain-containing protein n=1 Tax=Sesamum calycinum TaxID=2727403 RepID=A0AAW2SUV9_9LAMI
MSLRNLQLVDFPNPKYDKYGLERFVTIILYHGEVKHSPIAEFVGVISAKSDYQTDVLALCDGYSSKNREFTLYLEANSDEPATQIGSSNPIAVVGDEKGKGVAIEGGVSPRFDEEDWAEVDLQREGEGSGHSEGVGEGDNLHEFEYGPEDEENGENMDEEGVQKAELRASNPRSTVIMAMTEGDDGTDRRKFEKLYVCFDALRQGFLHGTQNNNLYPLAYAVVSGETRESWPWFLELLKGDLNVVRDHTYTFISDKQKGLIPAFESVFPATHLHMQKWDLTGIPCNHGMSAICSQSLEPEDFVNPCYSVETFLEARKRTAPPQNKQKEQSKKRKGVEVQATHNLICKCSIKKDYKEHPTSSCYRTQPSNNNRGTQPLLHRFTQCSTVQNVSSSGVPYLTRGGKKFVTMKNLTKVVAATKKHSTSQ